MLLCDLKDTKGPEQATGVSWDTVPLQLRELRHYILDIRRDNRNLCYRIFICHDDISDSDISNLSSYILNIDRKLFNLVIDILAHGMSDVSCDKKDLFGEISNLYEDITDLCRNISKVYQSKDLRQSIESLKSDISTLKNLCQDMEHLLSNI